MYFISFNLAHSLWRGSQAAHRNGTKEEEVVCGQEKKCQKHEKSQQVGGEDRGVESRADIRTVAEGTIQNRSNDTT